MKSDESSASIMEVHNPFMESLEQKDFSLPTGVFHLTYDTDWSCVFVSGECLGMLSCSHENFLEILQSNTVLRDTHQETLAGNLLVELAMKAGQCACKRISRCANGQTREIRITMTSYAGPNGTMQLYGQMADVSDPSRKIKV